MPSRFTNGDDVAARLAGLLDSAMDGILSVDENQAIVMYNRAAEKIFGWSAAEALGHDLQMLLPARHKAGHAALVARFGSRGVTSRRMGDGTTITGLRKDGTEFPMEASISQLETDRGKLYTVILRDVTEREVARQELATLAAEASGVREQEKSRIARELHDELAQSLTALKMDTIWVRDNVQAEHERSMAKLNAMLGMLDESVAATRRIAADLRPLVLDDLGLAAAIEWLAHSFQQRTGMPCDLDIDEDLDLPEPYATGIFRIVQESLHNVAKHANSTVVRVRVARERDAIVLSVNDNGQGFEAGGPRKPQSLGIVGLRERAQLLKGQLQVTSVRGEGTRVEARIPVQGAE